MIESLRAFAGTLTAKILLALMIASFAVFGVQVAAFGGYTIAEIGDEEVSVPEFRRAYIQQMRQIEVGRRNAGLRDPFTVEQAVAVGVPAAVLSRLMRFSALGQEARRLGVDAPDDSVRRRIEADPSFQLSSGFDPDLYDRLLRSQGYRKTDYEEEQRRRIAVGMLVTPIALGLSAPKEAGLALWRRENETRKVGYLTLSESQIGEIEDPGDEVLRAHHNDQAPRFTTPERRKMDVLIIDPEELAEPDAIDEERLRAAYEDAGAQYNQPERRNLERLDFATQDEAAAAVARVRGGASLTDIAAERAGSAEANSTATAPEDVSLGYVTKSQMAAFTPELAEKAFAEDADGVLEPIKIGAAPNETWAVLRIAGVLPGRFTPFEEARDELARELAAEAARRETPQLANDVEDARAAGAGFEEIAQDRRGVRFMQIETDNTGRDPEGARIVGLPQDPRFLQEAFEQAQGEERDLSASADQSYWTTVTTALTPAALRPFEEAREDVLADWRSQERARLLEERASEAVKRIEEGEQPETVAAELGVEYEVADGVLRLGGGALPQAAVQRVFSLAQDVAVGRAVVAPDGPRRLVLTTLETTWPDPDAADAAVEAKRAETAGALAQDLLQLYENAIQASFDQEVDARLLDEAARLPIR